MSQDEDISGELKEKKQKFDFWFFFCLIMFSTFVILVKIL